MVDYFVKLLIFSFTSLAFNIFMYFMYEQKVIPLLMPRASWLSNIFVPGTLTVCVSCLVATTIWYYLSTKNKFCSDTRSSSLQAVWFGLWAIPIAAVGFTLYQFNIGKTLAGGAPFPLTIGYLINFFILYWLASTIVSVGNTKYVPLFAREIRKLLSSLT